MTVNLWERTATLSPSSGIPNLFCNTHTLDGVDKIIEISQNSNLQDVAWTAYRIALLADQMARINSFLIEEINNRLTQENLREGEWGTSEEMGNVLRRSQEIAEQVRMLTRSLTDKDSV